MNIDSHLTLFDKSLQLMHYPQKYQHPSWRAWDAADEYLINYIEESVEAKKRKNMLILNDDFGALSCWFSDSHPQHRATLMWRFVPSTQPGS